MNLQVKTTSLSRDVIGAASIDALGNRTTYAYDQFGNLSSVTDPLGNATIYEYELLSYNTLESLLHDEAEAYFDKVLKEWHDANNAYQKDEETKGRHKEFEKIKTEYDKKRKGK